MNVSYNILFRIPQRLYYTVIKIHCGSFDLVLSQARKRKAVRHPGADLALPGRPRVASFSLTQYSQEGTCIFLGDLSMQYNPNQNPSNPFVEIDKTVKFT